MQAEQSIGNYPPGTGTRCLPRPQKPHAIFIRPTGVGSQHDLLCRCSVDRIRLSWENRRSSAGAEPHRSRLRIGAAPTGDVPEVMLGVVGTMPGMGDRGRGQPCSGIELICFKKQENAELGLF